MRHKTPLLNISALAITFLLISLHFTTPETLKLLTPWFLGLSVVVIGIPHGAIDHVVAAHLFQFGDNRKGHIMFYSSYLATMLVIGLLWIFLPFWGLLFFLAISIYHFGQSDTEALLSSQKSDLFLNKTFTLVRGTTIIGLILFAHPEISAPIISDAIRSEPTWLDALYQYSDLFIYAVIGSNLLISIPLIYNSSDNLTVPRYQFLSDQFLVIALFYFLNPLLSFSVYFALWHSSGHVSEMLSFFKNKGKTISLSGFYKLATPFTLISFVGLLGLWVLQSLVGIEQQLITILFILISVLTVPHMIVADRMLRLNNID